MKENQKKNKKKEEKKPEFKLMDLSDVKDPNLLNVTGAIIHNSQSISPKMIAGAGITGLAIILVFGKVIVATTALSAVAYTAGKIVKRVKRGKKS